MIDGIRFYFCSRYERAQLLRNKEDLGFSGRKLTDAIDQYHKIEPPFYVRIYETKNPGIRFDGSIHKYAHGVNNDTFTLTEVQRTIDKLKRLYNVPDSAKIERIEIGINMPFTFPKALIDSAMLFNGRVGERKYRQDYYANEWFFTSRNKRVNYIVKLYQKGEQLLRYELHVEDLRKIKNTGIKYLNDLLSREKLLLALKELYRSIDYLFFVPYDREQKLPFPYNSKWNGYRADSFWKELDGRVNKDKKAREKARILNAIKKYGLIDWAKVMKERFLNESVKITDRSKEELRATFSHRGLLYETVAGPQGNRDRRTEKEKTYSYPSLIHPVVRNMGCWLDVQIITLSFHPLLPRGPPSSLSIFRFPIYAYNVARLIPVVARISLISMVFAS